MACHTEGLSPHPVLLPASSPWRACISTCPHPLADADGEGTLRQPYSFENCARNAQQRPLSQGERDRVRGCDLRSWQRPPVFAATPLRALPLRLFHARPRWHNPRDLCTCFAFPSLHSPAQRICGGSCQEWNGGGDDSVHSSVVAPAPQGFAPACRLRRYASASTPRKTSTPIPPI